MGLHRTLLVLPAAVVLLVAVVLAISPYTMSMARFVVDMGIRGQLAPDDGRQERLLQFVLGNSTEGNAQQVLDAVDRYAWSKEFFMNVGDVKGKIIQKALANMTDPPKTLLELGTYCGYGAINIATSLSPAHKAMLYTIEPLERNQKVAQAMVNHAGLQTSITILPGILSDHVTTTLKALGQPLDFVFIDHMKELYVPDLQLLMDNGLLAKGTVVVADNVKFPGAPEYYKYMEASNEFETEWHYTQLEYSKSFMDIVGVSIYVGGSTAA